MACPASLPGEQHLRRKDRGFQPPERGFALSAIEQGDRLLRVGPGHDEFLQVKPRHAWRSPATPSAKAISSFALRHREAWLGAHPVVLNCKDDTRWLLYPVDGRRVTGAGRVASHVNADTKRGSGPRDKEIRRARVRKADPFDCNLFDIGQSEPALTAYFLLVSAKQIGSITNHERQTD